MWDRRTSPMLHRGRPDHILQRQGPRVYIHAVFGLYLCHERIEMSFLDKGMLAFVKFGGLVISKLFPCRRKRGSTRRKIGEASAECKIRQGDKTPHRPGQRFAGHLVRAIRGATRISLAT